MKRKRRTFTEEFKQESSRLVLESGKSTRQIANELGIGEALLGRWVKTYQTRGGSEGLSPAEREELKRLRKEVKRLEMERDILKKATAFFVKEQQ
jgi:transposase